MKSSLLFCLYACMCFFIGFVIASEQQDIDESGSYNNTNLICRVFKIGGSCNTNNVQATSGKVGGSMNINDGVIKEQLIVDGSLTIYGMLHVSQYKIGGTLTAKKIETQQANVGGSITVKQIFCENNLTVGGSLCTKLLQCSAFKVGGTTTADRIYAAEGKINGSIHVKQEASFTKNLLVGGLLNCVNLKNFGSTKVGGTIKAQNSIFKDISIKSMGGHSYKNSSISCDGNVNINIAIGNNNSIYNTFSFSTLFYAIFYPIWRYFFGGHQIALNVADEKSKFEDCTIESMLINKNNSAKQIIELKNTQVTDKIIFTPDTKGEVWLYGNSRVGNTEIPNVQNGNVRYKKFL
jgi:cytoskeletal protein CcmA (bactofilin family)